MAPQREGAVFSATLNAWEINVFLPNLHSAFPFFCSNEGNVSNPLKYTYIKFLIFCFLGITSECFFFLLLLLNAYPKKYL